MANNNRKHSMKHLSLIFVSLLSLYLIGCSNEQKPKDYVDDEPMLETNESELEDRNAVGEKKSQDESELDRVDMVAIVGDEVITQSELDFAIENIYKNFQTPESYPEKESIRKNVLESLVAAKAIKHQMLQDLDQVEKQNINRKILAYADELYVKAYLQRHVNPQPVSTKMVKSYYDQNMEEFGGGDEILVEMLKMKTPPSEEQRDTFLGKIDQLRNEKNWKSYSANTLGNLKLEYFRTIVRPELFVSAIHDAIDATAEGETSNMVFVDGIPHIVRILSVTKQQPQSLADVSRNIRKKLAAIQLKASVKEASIQALENTKVQYAQ